MTIVVLIYTIMTKKGEQSEKISVKIAVIFKFNLNFRLIIAVSTV